MNFLAATFTDPEQLNRLTETIADIAFTMPVSALSADGWSLERPDVLNLMAKLRQAGKPLGEYVGGKLYRGVLTGLNEAFVIDGPTRERLIAEDPRSAEVIKPFYRGRDIYKWIAEWAEIYLLYIPWHFDIDSYPAIKKHLFNYKEQINHLVMLSRELFVITNAFSSQEKITVCSLCLIANFFGGLSAI